MERVACLGVDTIVELLEGRCDAATRARIDAHAARCEACRGELSALARGHTLVDPPGRAVQRAITEDGRIGRYELRDLLGAGGMGVVFAAYDAELARTVAVKVLRPGLDAAMADRLRREAQAMARLAHPNVVAVHDVGVDHGRVFVAMEHVDGETLARWLEAPRAPREILEVFRAAGAGLAAAHAAGLVHRDFKPENVLIGRDGRVRVVDFGLVRSAPGDAEVTEPGDRTVLEPDEAVRISDVGLTRTGVVLGTPCYMAPEQYRGEPADARSDQFSFCVALYGALYGKRPFAGDSFEALGAAVQAGSLQPPARAVRLARRTRRAIVRGLATEPAARFASLDVLLGELAPRPARWLAAPALVALAALAVLLVVTRSAAPAPCGGAADHLRGVWDPARKLQIAAAIAGTGAPFAPATVREVARAGDAYAAGWAAMHTEVCEATRVRGEQPEELLGRRMACLDARRRELDALAGQLATADRGVAEHAVDAVAALPALDACADLIALGAPVPLPTRAQAPGVAALRDQLADVRAMRDTGRWQAGLAAVRPMIARASAIGYRPLEAEALALAGALADDTGGYAEAAPWLERAALAGEAGRDDHTVARARIAALDVRYKAAAPDAEALRDRARAALERLGTPAELDAELRLTIGAHEASAGHIADATRELAAAIAILERRHGPDDLRLARPLRALGGAHARGSDVARARPALERALAIQRRALGDDHPEVAITLEVLGTADYMAARYDAAAATFLAAQRIFERALGPASFRVAEVLDWRAQTDGFVGRLDEAVALHRQAVAIDERALGRDHPTTLSHLDGLAMALQQAERPAEALALEADVLARLQEALGPDDRRIADALLTTALIELDLRRFAAARDHAEASRAMFGRVMGDAFRPFAQLRTIGAAWLGLGEPARAVPALEAAARGLSATADPEDRLWIEALLGRALYDAGHDRPRARALIASSMRALAHDELMTDERDHLAAWMAARGLR